MRPFDDSAKWMVVTFSADGVISSLSSAVDELTGFSPQELIGRPVTEILADRSVFEMPDMMESAREWGSWDGEIVHRERSGKSLEGRGSLSVLAGSDNTSLGFCLVSVFDAYDTGMHSSAPLSQVGIKLRNFAHELNNPLAVIMGFTQLTMLNVSCNGKVRADMEKLYAEMKRVIQVVERLHSYALVLQDDQPDLERKIS